MIRLDELHLWLTPRWVEDQLKRAALQPQRHPLAQAIAWWLVRNRALERLDIKTVRPAIEALGLQTGFVYRPGPAPHPSAVLKKDDWRVYPTDLGQGVIWLDSVIRPRTQSQATLASQLVSKTGGPAVLRMGYDDAVTVWLNGDEVYSSDESHNHWLDQAAVRVHLRPGANRLVIQVDQKSNAWRFMLRVTDARGEVLPVRTEPTPWGGPRAAVVRLLTESTTSGRNYLRLPTRTPPAPGTATSLITPRWLICPIATKHNPSHYGNGLEPRINYITLRAWLRL